MPPLLSSLLGPAFALGFDGLIPKTHPFPYDDFLALGTSYPPCHHVPYSLTPPTLSPPYLHPLVNHISHIPSPSPLICLHPSLSPHPFMRYAVWRALVTETHRRNQQQRDNDNALLAEEFKASAIPPELAERTYEQQQQQQLDEQVDLSVLVVDHVFGGDNHKASRHTAKVGRPQHFIHPHIHLIHPFIHSLIHTLTH